MKPSEPDAASVVEFYKLPPYWKPILQSRDLGGNEPIPASSLATWYSPNHEDTFKALVAQEATRGSRCVAHIFTTPGCLIFFPDQFFNLTTISTAIGMMIILQISGFGGRR